MSKNKIIATLIAVALIFSGVAAYLVYHYMSPARSTIFVFNDDYEIGTQVTADMLTPIQVDSTITDNGESASVDTRFVTPYEYSEIAKSGDSLRMNVSEGMPLTLAMLSVSGGSTVEMNMKSDAVAITIPVNSYSGVTNDLKEGAKVNIYYTNGEVTMLLQQNVRVLETFREEGSLSGVAVEEDIEGSMQIVNAMSNGSVYLGLVDATGYQATEDKTPSYSMPLIKSAQQEYNDMMAQVEMYQSQSEAEAVSNTVTDETETTSEAETETPADANGTFSLSGE